MNIETRQDRIRGCGWRKEGGLYLIADGAPFACGKLPLPLTICPTCGGGIKFSRGVTWINPEPLFKHRACLGLAEDGEVRGCGLCPLWDDRLHLMGDKALLLWVGEKFYSIESFTQEATSQGISRRIASIPHDFKLGKTWVFLAHKKGIQVDTNGEYWESAIFTVFKPSAIEYVVHPDDDEDKLNRLVKKGVTPVRIERVDEQGKLVFQGARKAGRLAKLKKFVFGP